MKAALYLFSFVCVSAFGQDPGAMAAQQAQQDSQQAMQDAQQANQQAMQASQQAAQQAAQASIDAAQDSGPLVFCTQPPTFSVKSGAVTSGTTVRLKSPTHYAFIYYTADGWAPTTDSLRYTGPIRIDATTQLQAIAIAPNMAQSVISRANYTVQSTATLLQPPAISTDGVLYAGTLLRLVTNSTANSKTSQVGDNISLLLDQDIKVGDEVVAPRGTRVVATITQADSAGHGGTPGDLAFEIHSLTVHGVEVPLYGGETVEGANHYKASAILTIALPVPAGLLKHGDEAAIKPGMTLTAEVAADTRLQP